ncbi:hypothetical protein PoB_000238400 [Plakobranchus ocellatus]|uniref:CARMIL C-terminal domain-containing protein n=1 Tax=Plakobranchus ocellatus TaxID=259542 RepID=A0AAV3Y1N5_9GAST|nr:hypothetical protein PoB_000238400 [Plakobranchus ocellatus]
MAFAGNTSGHQHNGSQNNNSSFPYSLQPQPPPHPKITGGKRGPSAPIAIPSLAKIEDNDDDSDQSITDHTPPIQTGRFTNLDHSLSSSPSSSSFPSRGNEGSSGTSQLSSPRGQSVAAVKKSGAGIASPRTLVNINSNNNTNNNNSLHIINLNTSLSPATSSPLSSTSTTTPILIIHTANNNKVNAVDSNSNNSVSATSSKGPPAAPGSSLFAAGSINSHNGNGLTTSHPPAPWVSSQNNANTTGGIANFINASTKHGTLAQGSTSLSKVPKLVDNPIQPKGLKSSDNYFSNSSAADNSSLISHSSANSSSVSTTFISQTAANKSTCSMNNTLVVGIPENSSAAKPESLASTSLLLSPTDVSTGSDGDARASSPTSSSSNSFAYELDHDYENVASPCSSTASGPTYVRQPGFRHHAHEVTLPLGNSTTASSPSSTHATPSLFSASLSPSGNGGNSNFRLKQKKKCSATLMNFREGFKKREATPPKLKPKREPLPMKLRALPQSFWQQPNVAQQVSPATLFPILPPLPNKDNEESLMDVRPVTPPEEREASKKIHPPERKLTVANTDLLFKLFDVVADDKKASMHKTRQQNKPPRKPVPKSNTKGLFLGNDPYMVEAVTEKIFPQLTLEAGSRSHGYQVGAGNSSLQLISLKEGDRTVQLPSLSMEQNYPQMLSELVMHI